jgi:hypothetical protein
MLIHTYVYAVPWKVFFLFVCDLHVVIVYTYLQSCFSMCMELYH